MPTRQIIALGGGGFSMEPDNPLLDLYILAQSDAPKPRVLFIPTASGDAKDYIERFHAAFENYDCEHAHLSLFFGDDPDIAGVIRRADIVFVGGGNTRNMLTLWREWGVVDALRQVYEEGRVLAGISAGAICWFEQGATDSIPGTISALKCLGWLSGSNCPHYDGEAKRRPACRKMLEAGELIPGYACDDSVALHFKDEVLSDVITSVAAKRAWKLGLAQGKASEEEIIPRFLG